MNHYFFDDELTSLYLICVSIPKIFNISQKNWLYDQCFLQIVEIKLFDSQLPPPCTRMVKLSPVCQTNLASQVKNNNIQLRHMRVIWWWCTEEDEGQKADREDRTWQGQRWRHRNEPSRTAQTLWLNSTFIYFPTKFAGKPVTRCHVTDLRSLLLLSGSAWTCLFFVPGGSSILPPHWSEEPHTKWPTYISSVRLKVTEKTARLSANNSSSPVKSMLLNKQNTPWSLVK